MPGTCVFSFHMPGIGGGLVRLLTLVKGKSSPSFIPYPPHLTFPIPAAIVEEWNKVK